LKMAIRKSDRKAASVVSLTIFHWIDSVIGGGARHVTGLFMDELGRGLTEKERALAKKHMQIMRDEADWWRRFGRHLDGRR
jgi:hypothetical protein